MSKNRLKFKQLILSQKESGLSITDFCKREKIAQSTFYYWKKVLVDASNKVNKRPVFVPVKISPSAHNTKISPAQILTITLSSGIVLTAQSTTALYRNVMNVLFASQELQ